MVTDPKTQWYNQSGAKKQGYIYQDDGITRGRWATWANVDGVRFKVLYEPMTDTKPGRIITAHPDSNLNNGLLRDPHARIPQGRH